MNDIDRVELNELCSGLVDGTLTDGERMRLQEFLRGSAEARQFYVRAMHLSSSLHSYASEMLSEPAEPANMVRPDFRRRAVAIIAAAAAVMIGLWFGWAHFHPPAADEEDGRDTVARLTGSKDCEWKGLVPDNGDEVAVGQRLELVRGFAELTFDCGAQVVVEGPAVLNLRSAWETELEKGTLKATVPEEARGFRVLNAAVEVVDLGTEFSMTAGNGETEVLVLKGSVEVHPKDAAGNRKSKSVLQEKQGKRFAGAGALEIRDRDAKFLRAERKVTVEPIKRPLAYAQWSFGEGAGGIAEATGSVSGLKPVVFDQMPAWTEGRFGSAVRFDGETRGRTELVGSLKRGVKTVAFWTRMPPSPTLPDSGAFVSFPINKPWARSMSLSWNRAAGEGAFGALRMQAGTGCLVGSTNLRDGRWHHVAVVLGTGGKGGLRPRAKLYLNGRLESHSGHGDQPREADKVTSVNDALLWIAGTAGSSERFIGEMDELVVADQQLSPQQIRQLIRTNLVLSYDAITGL